MAENLFEINTEEHTLIGKKDLAWSLSRLDLSLDGAVVTTVCKEGKQQIHSWSGFNSLVTDECLAQQTVGF